VGEIEIAAGAAPLTPLDRRLLDELAGPAGVALSTVRLTVDLRRREAQLTDLTQALATQDPRQLTWLPDGRTVLSVVSEYDEHGLVGYVSVLTLGEGHLDNRMVEVEHGDEIGAVRLVPLADGRVVLVTGDDASFFAL